MSQGKFRHFTVMAVVVANMVGTGVFTSLGFQLLDIRSGFVLLALWAVGGIAAVCGAMTYAELGAAMPRSGGEYNFPHTNLSPCCRLCVRLGFSNGRICGAYSASCDDLRGLRHLGFPGG